MIPLQASNVQVHFADIGGAANMREQLTVGERARTGDPDGGNIAGEWFAATINSGFSSKGLGYQKARKSCG